ncbi:acyl-CoA thioesterase [Sphingomonas abietis]|nr:thioesterase family protein [Sphingomonas abietis]
MQTAQADLRVVPPDTGTGRRPCNEFDLRAIEADIDHMGHVNNAVYLSWVQDVVVKHWAGLASDVELATTIWVAIKHEITYRRPAFLGDALSATVAATGFQGAKAMFDTVIRRGDQIVAEIRSVWCSIDTATRRPKRVAQEVVRRFSNASLGVA